MDDETKKLLAENYALNKENNEMLLKLIRFQKWNQIYKIAYWSIIILSTIGAFYFVKQYMGSLVSLYTGGASDMVNVDSTSKSIGGNDSQLQDLLKGLKGN